ncbi:MAG: type II toxin-antitoxin system RatA family toxin [Asticcacaulis sp.]
MVKVTFDRSLPFDADRLFEMVADVEKYPDYIPWISFMHVSNRAVVSEGVTRLDAEAGVGFKFLNERFSTRVTRDANLRTIEISLLKGPFKTLYCKWKFVPEGKDGGACRITLDMDFEFKNPFLTGFLRANFDKAVAKLVACFEGRAASLYPKTA